MSRSVFVLLSVILFISAQVVFSQRCAAQITDTAKNGSADTTNLTAAPADTVIHSTPPVSYIDKDSLAYALKPHPFQPNPKKAGFYAAILPGSGQIYNRQYWKIPIVYAGLGVAGYFIASNLSKYQKYRKAYVSRLSNSNYTDEFSSYNIPVEELIPYLKQYQDDYSKYLNLSVLFTGVGYFMQVLDAITSAHLRNFDMSRDISMHFQPVAVPNGLGLGLVMNFK